MNCATRAGEDWDWLLVTRFAGFLFAIVLGVRLCGLCGVMRRVLQMAVRHVGVMRRGFVLTCLVM
jgi:hypothetical protein